MVKVNPSDLSFEALKDINAADINTRAALAKLPVIRKYELLEKIGQGTFSQIYKGRNIRTNELIAIKIEPKTAIIKLLQNETRIYKYLNEA